MKTRKCEKEGRKVKMEGREGREERGRKSPFAHAFMLLFRLSFNVLLGFIM